MKHLLKAGFVAAVLCVAAGAAQACTSSTNNGQYHVIINSCPYDIIVRYTHSGSKHAGLSDRIRGRGGRGVIAAPANENMNYKYCDYDAYTSNRCKF